MIRSIALIAAALSAAPVVAQTAPPAQAAPPMLLLSDAGFLGSEAARYDDRADDYLVSNLGASGDVNDGFVSRVSPDGKVTQLKWIEGGKNGVTLIQPLGIFVKGDLVYVADVRQVRMFDRATGAPKGNVEVPDAVRLNDLTVAEDGTVYVSDSGDGDRGGALYRISKSGKVSPFVARNDALEKPNGIAVLADGTVVHGGRGVNLVYRDAKGRVLRERTLPTGRFDGIIPLPDGRLLVASQDGKNVYRVPVTGKAEIVAGDIAVPAAIGWDSKRNRLLVPQIRAATLSIYQLTE
ncbi:SMP-30/gluconolactonase/LRE family protein [Sphingomonas sp.]|jgi:hypothetical protein|uniref:SMP-30/gluconolactonase/LRE family protein n=1 Tax=Sphingomonas sp. TaxID=28214 RepID=UPI002ED7A273